MPLPNLIDKQDTFEIVRDQIASILITEIANQMSLATTAGKDPNDWKLRIFTERSNPWEQWLNEVTDSSPIVNVWYDGSTFDASSSGIVERQTSETIYNIDMYGVGQSGDDGTGQTLGDKEAALENQRAVRLVRNILMAAENTYLQLRGLVGKRWIQSISAFQPAIDANTVHKVVGSRIAFRVTFNEFSPQYDPPIIELITTQTIRAETGEILINANYPK